MSYQLKTKKGYDFFEASSAFQKAIRRCNESAALFWMAEFYDSHKGEYLWKRMMIIVAEDIGLAEPHLHTHVRELYESYKYMLAKKDKKKSERLFMVQAVLLMVRAKKSRLVDWALNIAWDSHNETRMEIPDYAIDIHSRRGKAMGKTINNFLNEGSHLENHKELPLESEYKEWCRERWNALDGKAPDGTPDAGIDVTAIKTKMGRFKPAFADNEDANKSDSDAFQNEPEPDLFNE